jgi:hypothetical protein
MTYGQTAGADDIADFFLRLYLLLKTEFEMGEQLAETR